MIYLTEVICDLPKVPRDGHIVKEDVRTVYKGGDVVEFTCDPGFMMKGNPISVCTFNSKWSNIEPTCEYNKL